MENTKVTGGQLASKSCKRLVNSVLLLAKPYVATLSIHVTTEWELRENIWTASVTSRLTWKINTFIT